MKIFPEKETDHLSIYSNDRWCLMTRSYQEKDGCGSRNLAIRRSEEIWLVIVEVRFS